MPHATFKYRFELRLGGWAAQFSERLTGHQYYPFIIILSPDGRAETIHFGHAPQQHDAAGWESLRNREPAWIMYDPFEGPESTYLCWQNVPIVLMQRITAETFGNDDFVAEDTHIGWPDTWGVMF